MPKLRHIGITTSDPDGTSTFYKNAFGMDEVSRAPEGENVVLSDGYFTITLMKFNPDEYGGGRPVLHHLGIQVEDLDQSESKIRDTGARKITDWSHKTDSLEGTPDNQTEVQKWISVDGIAVDVTSSGWRVSSEGEPGEWPTS